MTSSVKIQKGSYAEQLVATMLYNTGYRIVARNYRKRYGEIDIIVRNRTSVVFVEVKRRDTAYVDAAEVVMPAKQKKIVLVAKEFIATHTEYDEMIYRFDVALVDCNETTQTIRYIENAFTAE